MRLIGLFISLVQIVGSETEDINCSLGYLKKKFKKIRHLRLISSEKNHRKGKEVKAGTVRRQQGCEVFLSFFFFFKS